MLESILKELALSVNYFEIKFVFGGCLEIQSFVT